MTAAGPVLLDTSVIIATARGQLAGDQIGPAPDSVAVSAVTLAGLHHGVLVAPRESISLRLQALRVVEEACLILPVDQRVAVQYGRVAADARRLRGRRIALGDGLIAATALAHGLPLYTRDRDFEGLPGLECVVV